MAKTLAQIQKQIEKLQQQADALKAKEVQGVIERIRTAIDHYGITAKDLFGGGAGPKGPGAPKAAGRRRRSASPPKYRDDAGNSWTGRGKRPNWFKAAIASGKSPEDLLVK